MRGPQVQLAGVLGDAIGIFRLWYQVLRHRQLVLTVHGDRGRKHETLDAVIDGRIDKVNATDEVVFVIEPANEMAQALRRVSRQMKYVLEVVLRKQALNQRRVGHTALDKQRIG